MKSSFSFFKNKCAIFLGYWKYDSNANCIDELSSCETVEWLKWLWNHYFFSSSTVSGKQPTSKLMLVRTVYERVVTANSTGWKILYSKYEYERSKQKNTHTEIAIACRSISRKCLMTMQFNLKCWDFWVVWFEKKGECCNTSHLLLKSCHNEHSQQHRVYSTNICLCEWNFSQIKAKVGCILSSKVCAGLEVEIWTNDIFDDDFHVEHFWIAHEKMLRLWLHFQVVWIEIVAIVISFHFILGRDSKPKLPNRKIVYYW